MSRTQSIVVIECLWLRRPAAMGELPHLRTLTLARIGEILHPRTLIPRQCRGLRLPRVGKPLSEPPGSVVPRTPQLCWPQEGCSVGLGKAVSVRRCLGSASAFPPRGWHHRLVRRDPRLSATRAARIAPDPHPTLRGRIELGPEQPPHLWSVCQRCAHGPDFQEFVTRHSLVVP